MPRAWTDAEVRKLISMWFEKDVREIARELGRSVGAVEEKAKKLGLYRSRRKLAEYHPDLNEKVRKFWEEQVKVLEEQVDRLKRLMDYLEQKRIAEDRFTHRDLTAIAKAVGELRQIITDVARYLGIIERENLNVGTVNINVNLYQLVQIANEVMTPEQRQAFMNRLKEKGIIEEVYKP